MNSRQKTILSVILALAASIPLHAQTDSLRSIFRSRQDTHAVLAGYELGKTYIPIDLDSSFHFFLKAAHLADQIDFVNGKILSYRAIGSIAPRIERYDTAYFWLQKGLRLIDSLDLGPGNKVDFLTNLGVLYYRQGLIGKALEPYILAVEICRENGLDERRSRLLNNLGIFYRILERYEEALKIYDQSYALRESARDTMGMANNLFNMAAAHSKIKEPEEALSKLEMAEQLYRAINSPFDVLTCQIAKGTAYMDLDQLDLALEQFNNTLNNPEITSLANPFKINLYQGLAYVYLTRGAPDRAHEYLSTIRTDIASQATAEQISRNHELWSQIYQLRGQYRQAFEALLEFKKLSDTIQAKDNAKFRQEMETKYLTREKEYEISLLNTEKELTEVKLKAASQRNIGLGSGLILFGGLLIWLFRLFSITKKQHRIISKANQEKEVLLKEIHHRVKNNLQVVSSLLTLQSKYVDNNTALDAINTGKSRVQSMSILHRNLYQNENLKNIRIKPYFEDLTENLVSTYQVDDKTIRVITQIDDLELDVDTVIPMGLIANELISNALKYAFKGKTTGEIKIEIEKKDARLHLFVKDNGVGIPFTEIPSRSKTLGMQLIKSFAKKLKATIQIDNSYGTEIKIAIPLPAGVAYPAS